MKKEALKRLLKYLRPYTFLFIISLLLTAASVVCSLFVPVLSGRAIDHIIGAGQVDFTAVIRIISMIGIAIICGALSQYITSLINNTITFRIIKDLREEVFTKLQQLPLSFMDSKASGEMLSRCITDIEQISDGLLMGFTQVFNGILTIVCTVVFMLRIDVLITLFVVALTPLSFLLTKFIASKTHEMFIRQSVSRGEMTAFTDESIENMKLIYAFDHKEESRKEFDKKNEILAEHSLKATFFSSLVNPSTRLIYATLYAVVAMAGSLTVIGGRMTIGSLSAFLGYTNQYSKPFNEITGTIVEFQSALASASRVFEILDAPSTEDPYQAVCDKASIKGDVAIKDVFFSYTPQQKLVEDFNLNVKSGQRIAIVGPTGCGKTTIINLLMRFYDVNSGSISVDGTDIKDMSHVALRSHYGMVLQDIWLKDGTIRENIAYGRPDATLDEIKAAAKSAYISDYIERLPDGYETRITQGGSNLSLGQKQLMCIARVMLTDPAMLILDEATSSVDSMTEIRISKAFDKLMKGRTSFVVAHRLSTILNSDLILVMNAGSIVEQGTHEELIAKKGFYYNIYQSQFVV